MARLVTARRAIAVSRGAHAGERSSGPMPYPGRLQQVKRQIVEIMLNGSGVRDIVRVLQVSPSTVIGKLKEGPVPFAKSTKLWWRGCCLETITVEIRRVKAVEVHEMWCFVQRKAQQCWLWHAMDHLTGVVLAYVFGRRMNEIFGELQTLLTPFGLIRFSTDTTGAYDRHLPTAAHTVGKLHPQQIERKHLTVRTRIKRLARKTICFSKSVFMHDGHWPLCESP